MASKKDNAVKDDSEVEYTDDEWSPFPFEEPMTDIMLKRIEEAKSAELNRFHTYKFRNYKWYEMLKLIQDYPMEYEMHFCTWCKMKSVWRKRFLKKQNGACIGCYHYDEWRRRMEIDFECDEY